MSKPSEKWTSVRPWVQVIVGGYTMIKHTETWTAVRPPAPCQAGEGQGLDAQVAAAAGHRAAQQCPTIALTFSQPNFQLNSSCCVSVTTALIPVLGAL